MNVLQEQTTWRRSLLPVQRVLFKNRHYIEVQFISSASVLQELTVLRGTVHHQLSGGRECGQHVALNILGATNLLPLVGGFTWIYAYVSEDREPPREALKYSLPLSITGEKITRNKFHSRVPSRLKKKKPEFVLRCNVLCNTN